MGNDGQSSDAKTQNTGINLSRGYRNVISHNEPALMHSQSKAALTKGRHPMPLSTSQDKPVPIKNKVRVRLFSTIGTIQAERMESEGTRCLTIWQPQKGN